MTDFGKIITVGVSPAWDIQCGGDDIDWGKHSNAEFMSITPAGKALNVSKALARLGCKSIATGLWGEQDIKQLQDSMQSFKEFIALKMVPSKGKTRCNYWILNPRLKKEMHIRNKSELDSAQSIDKLKKQICSIAKAGDIIVFSGAMSQKSADVINLAAGISPYIAVDVSGLILRRLVHSKKVWLIKPNFQEFCELIGKKIKDDTESIFKEAKLLLALCPNILISRGDKGAVFVNEKFCLSKSLKAAEKQATTVGCGDFALAGFLSGLIKDKSFKQCLQIFVQTGAKRAAGKL